MREFNPQRIKDLRKQRSWTQGYLSRLMLTRCKVAAGPSQISGWENGSVLPQTKSLVALSDVFGVPIDYLFEEVS